MSTKIMIAGCVLVLVLQVITALVVQFIWNSLVPEHPVSVVVAWLISVVLVGRFGSVLVVR